MREYLRRNIWKFSVAKNYNDCIALSNLLIKKDGSLRPWNEFKKEAMMVVGASNRYLKTEYNTIVAAAQMTRKWQQIQAQKAIFPYVQFLVVLDDHTSDVCEPLHNVIVEVDDPMLSYFFPPNHFNCRTDVKQLRYGVPTKNIEWPEIPEAFKNNPGISEQIFTDQNSYIQNTPDEVLSESEKMADRWSKYAELLNDEDYHDVELGDNFGLKATHKDHQFHSNSGRYEKEARDILYRNGDEIILLSEKADEGVKTPDGMLNGKIMDIKTVLGNNGVLGKNNLINKIREGNGQGCEVVILQFPKESVDLYTGVDIQKQLISAKTLLQNDQQEITIKEIWLMLDEEIKKFNF